MIEDVINDSDEKVFEDIERRLNDVTTRFERLLNRLEYLLEFKNKLG